MGAPANYMPPGTTYSSTIPGSAGLLGAPADIRVADAFGMFNGISGDQFLQFFNYSGDGDSDGPFYIPELGFNYMLNDQMSLGLVVVGTGGMNTKYEGLAMFGGGLDGSVATNSGINLEQVRILPTLGYKINDSHSVGVSLQIAYQQFKAWGLNRFVGTTPQDARVSQNPDALNGKGRDDSWGFGISLGWQGKITDKLTIGAVYNSKIDMDEFDDYEGLFAEDGDLDVPENYGIGVAFQATDAFLVAFDIQYIKESDVDSVGNALQSGPFVGGIPTGNNMFVPSNYLGTDNGSGFGWDDITVYKLGLEYQWNKNLLLRAGYSYADQPIDKDQTFFNILAPAIIEHHGTVGMTYTLDNGSEISMFYMHAFTNEVKGRNSIPAAFGGGEADIKMSQDAVGIAYGWSF
jgi:long-chain fatty acid transport protein